MAVKQGTITAYLDYTNERHVWISDIQEPNGERVRLKELYLSDGSLVGASNSMLHLPHVEICDGSSFPYIFFLINK